MAGGASKDRVPKTATRDRILAATIALIAEGGVDAVTHRAVAARARVSLGSTTHHFSSREDLLRESFRFYIGQADAVIGELLAVATDRGVEPLERIRHVLRGIVEREFADEAPVRAEYELLLYARLDADLAAEVRGWEARIIGLLAEALESAGAERPVATARTLGNLIRGYELERLLDPGLTLTDFEERLAPFLAALAPSQA